MLTGSASWMSNGRVGHYRLTGWGTLMPWEERANCKNTPIELWFGDETPIGEKGRGRTKTQTRAAKAICAVCPVLEECRAWALEEESSNSVDRR
jgi:Transcription factor WhiB